MLILIICVIYSKIWSVIIVDGTKMRFIGIKKWPFVQMRILMVILICLALLVSIIPFLAFNSQSEDSIGEYTSYHSYEEMVLEIQKIEKNNSTIVKVHNLTTTFEGRTVWAVKVSDKPEMNESAEPDVLFMAGQKANSLISVETALYLLNYLTSNYGKNSKVTELVNNREIWILPMINPDGHEYIENETLDWQKNRRDNGNGEYGVNLNTNYGYEWGVDNHSSDDTSSQYYHGDSPFSEPETNAVKNLIGPQFVFSLSFSSYGRTITFPWGYSNSSASGQDILLEIASDMAMYSGYDVMQSGKLYINHGNVDDWLYNSSGVLPFTVLVGNEDIPDENQIEKFTKDQIPACLYLLDIADNPNKAFKAQWTFMVYMGGDNDLEEDGIRDFDEMNMVGSDPYVNIVVQFDRAAGEYVSNPDWTDTKRFLVKKDMEPIPSNAVESLGEVNMADPQVLLDFVNWSMTNYPAEHYFLDLWGHGQGWLGVTRDQANWLSMSDIKSVLPLFRDWIDVVGFDNCNMAMIEVYTQFLGHTDYIVGSEKEEDAWGWPYDRIFADLVANPQMPPVELSTLIVTHFVDWARNESAYSTTASVIDMNYLSEVINSTEALARELNWTFPLYISDIGKAVLGTEQYARPPYPHDLYHFAELIEKYVPNRPIQIAAENLIEDINTLVVAEDHFTRLNKQSVNNAHGIAIWMGDGSTSDFTTYRSLDFAKLTLWDEFLQTYKNPPPKPQVLFNVNYVLSDSDNEGSDDTVTIKYSTNVTGLNITIEVCNNENQHIITFYTNGTIEDQENEKSFNPYDFSNPSDYYNFYIYLINDENELQNYSEIADLWLGNERPDALLENLTFYRKDGKQVGGNTSKKPIDGENTLIKVQVRNNGTNPLSNIKIEFLEGTNSIKTDLLNLGIEEEKIVTAEWLARAGGRSIWVVLDGENQIKETNESNNRVTELVEVKPNIPVNTSTIRGKVYSKDKINIIGAKVQIKNMRTNATINKTTNENGYEVVLEPNWYFEGDEVYIRATYSGAAENTTILTYSEESPIYVNITLDTDVYDFLYYFKIGLMIFEIIGFGLVIYYYIGIRRQKGKA